MKEKREYEGVTFLMGTKEKSFHKGEKEYAKIVMSVRLLTLVVKQISHRIFIGFLSRKTLNMLIYNDKNVPTGKFPCAL